MICLQASSTTVSVLSEKRRSWSPCRGAAFSVDEPHNRAALRTLRQWEMVKAERRMTA